MSRHRAGPGNPLRRPGLDGNEPGPIGRQPGPNGRRPGSYGKRPGSYGKQPDGLPLGRSETQQPGRGRRRTTLLRLLAGLGALALALAGFGYLISSQPGKQPGARLVEPSPPAAGSQSVETNRVLPAPVLSWANKPVQVRLPAIGVDSRLQPLGLLPDGSLQPPSHWQQAGWYAGGTVPGEVGPAVIAGHVDSVSGPAVFYRLRELRPGDEVLITRQDGRVLRFLVDDVAAYAKRSFPTEAVYGPAATPQLRLITCTGSFDYQARSYRDNLVVSAHLR